MTDKTLNEVIQQLLKRLMAGDRSARDELIAIAARRLRALASRMMDDYARLRSYEQSDDVFQNAVMRLYRSLESVVPTSPREFLGGSRGTFAENPIKSCTTRLRQRTSP